MCSYSLFIITEAYMFISALNVQPPLHILLFFPKCSLCKEIFQYQFAQFYHRIKRNNNITFIFFFFLKILFICNNVKRMLKLVFLSYPSYLLCCFLFTGIYLLYTFLTIYKVGYLYLKKILAISRSKVFQIMFIHFLFSHMTKNN